VSVKVNVRDYKILEYILVNFAGADATLSSFGRVRLSCRERPLAQFWCRERLKQKHSYYQRASNKRQDLPIERMAISYHPVESRESLDGQSAEQRP